MFWPVVPRAAPTQRAGVLPRHGGLACLGGAGNAIGPGVTAGVVAQGGRPGVRQVEVDGVGIAVSSVWPVSDVSEDPSDRHLTPRELLRLPVTSPGEPAALVVSDMQRHGAIASPVRARFTRSRRMARSGQACARPAQTPQAAAAAREDRASLRRMLARCRWTVCSLKTSCGRCRRCSIPAQRASIPRLREASTPSRPHPMRPPSAGRPPQPRPGNNRDGRAGPRRPQPGQPRPAGRYTRSPPMPSGSRLVAKTA